MIVEEKKADEKVCCGPNAANLMCAGSRCMAWRWEDVLNPDYKPQHSMAFPLPPYDKTPLTIKSTTHGFCGLAGRP